MKKTIFLITGLISIISISGQNYFPLVEENKEWNVLHVGYNWNFTDTIFTTTSYKIEGDTVIGLNTYFKVYYSQEEYPVNWTYKGCVREDQDKKVYLHYWGDDYLIYDFGVEVGDTIEIFDNSYPVETLVEATDSIFINGSYRKSILLNYLSLNGVFERWIEGVGSNRGFLESGTAGYVGGWYWCLCMSQNGELIYMYPNYNACYLISTGIDEINGNELEIYPNPTSHILTLKFPNPARIESISITDLKGQKIRNLEYSKEIDLTGIPSGIYLLKLNLDNGELMKKIVIK